MSLWDAVDTVGLLFFFVWLAWFWYTASKTVLNLDYPRELRLRPGSAWPRAALLSSCPWSRFWWPNTQSPERRSRNGTSRGAPMSNTPQDPFEKNVSSILRAGPAEAFFYALVGGLALLVATFSSGPLVYVPTALLASIALYYIFAGQIAAIAWLARHHGWEPHVRALLASIVMLIPPPHSRGDRGHRSPLSKE